MQAPISLVSGAVLALALASPGTWAQGSTSSGTSAGPTTTTTPPTRSTAVTEKKTDKMARGDRKFLENAAESGMFEVQAAQLAASRATDPEVKSFANMLAEQHAKANSELTQLAQAKGVAVAATPPRAMRRKLDKLDKQKGADFDREFVREVGVRDHQKDIEQFEKASKGVKDADLKAFVDKTLPTLREHLAAAQKLRQAGAKARESSAARSGAATSTMGNTGTPATSPQR